MTIVLTRGTLERLHSRDETLKKLDALGVYVVVDQAELAVKYNELVDAGVPVGALIHSTC